MRYILLGVLAIILLPEYEPPFWDNEAWMLDTCNTGEYHGNVGVSQA